MSDQPIIPAQLVTYTAPKRSRVEQLLAAYPEAKARADEAAAQLKVITDGIKAEVTAAFPGHPKLVIQGSAASLSLTYSESWRIDSTKLKAEDPETYVRYAKKSGAWTLRQLGGAQ